MKKLNFKVAGLNLKYFLPFFIIVIVATYAGWMPVVTLGEGVKGVGMVGTLAFLMAVGGIFFWFGSTVPILNNYLGGAALVTLFGPALLKYFNLIPETTVKGVSMLMKYGLQDVYIACLLVGSIMVIDRKILLGAIVRYLPAILASQVLALGFAVVGGVITGFGGLDALFNVAIPTMSGGTGGALVTIPNLYTQLSGQDLTGMSGVFLCYVSIANVIAVLMAALSKPVCKKLGLVSDDAAPAILRKKGATMATEAEEKLPALSSDPNEVVAGIFMCLGVYLAGVIIAKLPVLSNIASLAWAIIIAVVLKCTGIMDNKIANHTVQGMNFMLKGLLPTIIAGIGVNSISIETLIKYISVQSLIVIFFGVLGAMVGAVIFGHLFGLWGYEAGITAGLCCCNIGGSGDLAVLTACDRMGLLAFSSISTRIGGALMVVWAGILYPLLMK